MVIGFDTKHTEQFSEIDETLENLRYMCTDESGFSEEKYEYYKQIYLNYYQKNNDRPLEVTEPIEMIIPGELPPTITSGPMDSAWPMKCHDVRHTGRSPIGTADNPSVELWRYEFEYGADADPAIGDDGTIYISGSYDELCYYLFAIYPNGTLRWNYYAGGLIWFMCPAIAEDGTIYFGSWDNNLHALNPDGSLKWKFDTNCNIVSDPVIAEDGTIYFGTFGGPWTTPKLYAIYPNGTEKWHYEMSDDILSDPAIGDDGTIYVGSCDNSLYAIYPNGTKKWHYGTGDSIPGPPSIGDNGIIYFASFDDYLYALYPNGTLRWKTEIWYGSDTNPSIGLDGTIYICSASKLFAISPDNGDVKWEFDLGGDVMHSSSAICADGIIYTGLDINDWNGGEIIAVNPDGTERWRERISNQYVDSSPAIGDDGTIYILSSSKDPHFSCLHAFGRGSLIVDAGGPYSGYAGRELQFTGTIFGGIPPYTYHWDFGDDGTSDEQNPIHIYSDIGEYMAIFSVIDSEGNYSSDNTSVTIVYPPPTVSIIKPKRALYFMNLMIRPYLLDRKPLIFGLINIKASATNDYLDIGRVEFFINNELVKTDEMWPYNWLWQGSGSLEEIHEIEVTAYDSEGKSASDSIEVRKFL